LSDSFSFGRIAARRRHVSALSRLGVPYYYHEGGATYIRPRTAQIDDLGTPIPVLLEACALKAVEGVRDTLATADHALVLVISEAALVAYPDERRRPHVRVAHGALAVALVAEPPDGDAGLFAAHYQIAFEERKVSMLEIYGKEGDGLRVMARHGYGSDMVSFPGALVGLNRK
jgi:hypothetical protein